MMDNEERIELKSRIVTDGVLYPKEILNTLCECIIDISLIHNLEPYILDESLEEVLKEYKKQFNSDKQKELKELVKKSVISVINK